MNGHKSNFNFSIHCRPHLGKQDSYGLLFVLLVGKRCQVIRIPTISRILILVFSAKKKRSSHDRKDTSRSNPLIDVN